MLFNYTSELRNYIEQQSDPSLSLSNKQLIEAGRTKLFDFEYPIFDEAYKGVFETHFIRKFYMRQIGFETFGLFKFQLETWLIINMGYFNKLFESELMEFDPLLDIKTETTRSKTSTRIQNDVKTGNDSKVIDGETNVESERTGTASKNENSNANNIENSTINGSNQGTQGKEENGSLVDDAFSRKLESTNPDNRLQLTAVNGVGVIEYANNIKEDKEINSKSTNNSESSNSSETSSVDSAKEAFVNASNIEASTNHDNVVDNTTSNVTVNDTKNDTLSSNITNIEDYLENYSGKIGKASFSNLLTEYRSTLIRIENSIFDEMNELFMLVY